MNLAGLPVHPLSSGMLGVRILDWSDKETREEIQRRAPVRELPYDEMTVSYGMNAIIVGELAHFLWRQLQIALNNEVRNASRENIRRHAERILGESWKLADE